MTPKEQLKNKALKISEQALLAKDKKLPGYHAYLLGQFHGLILAAHILYPQTKLNRELQELKTEIAKRLKE